MTKGDILSTEILAKSMMTITSDLYDLVEEITANKKAAAIAAEEKVKKAANATLSDRQLRRQGGAANRPKIELHLTKTPTGTTSKGFLDAFDAYEEKGKQNLIEFQLEEERRQAEIQLEKQLFLEEEEEHRVVQLGSAALAADEEEEECEDDTEEEIKMYDDHYLTLPCGREIRVIPVSANTGAGIPQLYRELLQLSRKVSFNAPEGSVREHRMAPQQRLYCSELSRRERMGQATPSVDDGTMRNNRGRLRKQKKKEPIVQAPYLPPTFTIVKTKKPFGR